MNWNVLKKNVLENIDLVGKRHLGTDLTFKQVFT